MTAAAPISDAFSNTIAKRVPEADPRCSASSLATAPALVKCPKDGVPTNANAVTAMSAPAPMTTTNVPITVSTRS